MEVIEELVRSKFTLPSGLVGRCGPSSITRIILQGALSNHTFRTFLMLVDNPFTYGIVSRMFRLVQCISRRCHSPNPFISWNFLQSNSSIFSKTKSVGSLMNGIESLRRGWLSLSNGYNPAISGSASRMIMIPIYCMPFHSANLGSPTSRTAPES